jgi:cell wall assembly regulator SMI1
MGLSILPLDAALRAEQREGFDDVDLADDCSAMNHPAWIPFAEDHEFEVYFINTNLRSRTFGEIILWTINCGDEDHKARSLYHFLSILRRERRDW